MARYKDAVCRLCRREGTKLFLKGAKCFMEKCPVEKRNFAPGQHGKDRKAKIVGYGLQLREKQKVRRVYGVLERQFRGTFEKAALAKNIPSFQVNVGEEIAIRESSRKLVILEAAKDFASHQTSPNWLEIDRENYKGRVLALPRREDINLPVNEQLIVELYSK